jgi:hypothetical protein
MRDGTEVSVSVDFLINYNNIDKVKSSFVLVQYFVLHGKGITIDTCAGYVGAFYRALKHSVKCTSKMC